MFKSPHLKTVTRTKRLECRIVCFLDLCFFQNLQKYTTTSKPRLIPSESLSRMYLGQSNSTWQCVCGGPHGPEDCFCLARAINEFTRQVDFHWTHFGLCGKRALVFSNWMNALACIAVAVAGGISGRMRCLRMSTFRATSITIHSENTKTPNNM